jgi:hypothetical protein
MVKPGGILTEGELRAGSGEETQCAEQVSRQQLTEAFPDALHGVKL